jgi:hypothetical protein
MDGERRQEEQDIKIELRAFIAGYKQWQLHTDEYRKELCSKVEEINKKIDFVNLKFYELPCEKRVGVTKGIQNQLNWLWIFISGCILAIVGAFFKK